MRGKKIKKVIALMLSLAMLLGVAGCGKTQGDSESGKGSQNVQGSEPTDTSKESEVAGPYTILTDADGNKIDLGGIEIVIRDWFSLEERQENPDNYTKARYDYWDWAMTTYNFKIKEAPVTTWENCIQELIDYTSTGGDDNCYIFHMKTDDAVFSAINNEMVYDVSKLDCLDFTDDRWVDAVTELYGKGDSVYGFRSYNMGNALGGRGMFFNKQVLREAGVEPSDLYTWQRNGEWTWDKFKEVCAKVDADLDADGVTDRFAMVGPKNIWFTMAVYSNEGNFIGKDDKGNFFNDLESNNTMTALNWAQEMWNQYDAHKAFREDAAWNDWEAVFTSGKAAFSAAELWRAKSFHELLEDNLGYVCYPKGPEATEYANVCSDAAYFLPACYDEEKAWKIMFAFNLYTADTPGYEGERPWRNSFYQEFGDLESVDDTVNTLMEHARPAYDTGVPGASPNDVINAITEDSTPAQAAETVKDTWAVYIEEANN